MFGYFVEGEIEARSPSSPTLVVLWMFWLQPLGTGVSFT